MSNLVRVKKKQILIIFAIFLVFFSFANIGTVADDDEGEPDLIITTVSCPSSLYEREKVVIPVRIKNQGDGNISSGTRIKLALKIDGVVVSSNSTTRKLDVGTYVYINISWTPTYEYVGEHLLRFEVDYDKKIVESNENNNIWDKPNVEIFEGDPLFTITSVYYNETPVPTAGEMTKIFVDVVNEGKDTTSPISVIFEDVKAEKTINNTKDDGLERNETYTFDFNWTPSFFGMQTLTLDVKYKGDVHHSVEFEIHVDIKNLKWYNDNWHYRQLLIVNGIGNISINYNFTKLLDDLGVTGQNFENNTIRIVEYSLNGNIKSVVKKYNFKENPSFNPVSNAVGKLIWNVTNTASEKYFCIYFDVNSNLGNRTKLDETNMAASGGVSLNKTSFTGGWWANLDSPLNQSYHLLNEKLEVVVKTVAKINNATAKFYYDDILIKTVYLSNQTANNISWNAIVDFLDKIGEWKIIVNCTDPAGYYDVVEHVFYVNKPDFQPFNITFSTDWPATSPDIYKNDTVTATGYIYSYNVSIEDIKVNLTIYDIKNKKNIYCNEKNADLYVDKNNTVDFTWTPTLTGDYNVTITVDPYNVVDESNEINNQMTKKITVKGWPDLGVKKISLPDETITETDNVTIDVTIVNKELVKAYDYEVILYIESVDQKIMKYENKVDNLFIDIGKDTSKKTSLTWADSEAGEWLVGVMVNVTDENRDTNTDNNHLLCDEILVVDPINEKAPSISLVSIKPSSYLQQSETVIISADVTDDTGLYYVEITITNPDNESVTNDMIRTGGNTFSYEFEDTDIVGVYEFIIKAVDSSIYEKKSTYSNDFIVFSDTTKPEVYYFDAHPNVQLVDEYVELVCIPTDNVEVETVDLIIEMPTGGIVSKVMSWSTSGKYVYKAKFEEIGEYKFYVKVKDSAGNLLSTQDYTKSFWITKNLDDTDNDGIPDWWEEKYKLDPKNPSDAENDDDKDGYTNLREYKEGFNPKKNLFLQNVAQRFEDNTAYLIGSIIIFIILIALTRYAKRRRIL